VIDAVVAWSRGEQFGLSFKIEPLTKAQTKRTNERFSLDCQVLVRRQNRREQRIDGIDVSVAGCALSYVDAPRLGELIWIKLPGLEAIPAKIEWAQDFRCGASFERRIHPAVFDLMLTRIPEIRKRPAIWERLQT
jgi:hypothetical protein